MRIKLILLTSCLLAGNTMVAMTVEQKQEWLKPFEENNIAQMVIKKGDVGEFSGLLSYQGGRDIATALGYLTKNYNKSDRRYRDIIEFFLQVLPAGALKIADDVGKTPLMNAAERGDLDLVKLLFTSDNDVNAIDMFGSSALWFASKGGHTEVIDFLLTKGAQVTDDEIKIARDNKLDAIVKKLEDAKSKQPSAPPMPGPEFFNANKNAADLIAAIEQSNIEAIRTLLKKPFNPTFSAPDTGYTPLMAVAMNSDISDMNAKEFAKAIIAAGADKNGIVAGFTPIAAAAKNGSLGVVEALIELGANLVGQVGKKTALDMAREEEKQESGAKKIKFQRIINALEKAQALPLTNFAIAPTPTPSPAPGPVGMQPLVASMQKLRDQLTQLTATLQGIKR